MDVTVVQVQDALRNYRGLFKGLAKKDAPSVTKEASESVKNTDTVHISEEARQRLEAPKNADQASPEQLQKRSRTIYLM